MNTDLIGNLFNTLNELARELARVAQLDESSFTLDALRPESVPLTWRVMGSFSVRPEFARELAGNWFNPTQMSRNGFIPLGTKRVYSLGGERLAMNVGLLNPEDASRIVRMIERTLPPAAREQISEIRFFLISPSDFFHAMEALGRQISGEDHPILTSYLKIHKIVDPILKGGQLNELEILECVKQSLALQA
jgi:hypothetical protein